MRAYVYGSDSVQYMLYGESLPGDWGLVVTGDSHTRAVDYFETVPSATAAKKTFARPNP